MLNEAVRIINEMHAKGIVWGELIVKNMIRATDGEIIICDTETVYYRGSLVERKASDWLDFICSACGAIAKLHSEEIDGFILAVLERIEDNDVKQCLKEKCERKITRLHRLFSICDLVRLDCPPSLYGRVRSIISLS